MKKLLLTLFITLCTLGISMAQDLEKATEIFNTAATSLNDGNNTLALDQFQQALKMAETLGEDGAEIVSQCKGIIPKLIYSVGKDYAAAKDLDNAIITLKKAVEVAKEYGDAETITNAQELMPQILMADAGSLLNEKKFAEAATAYKKVIDVDPENGMAYLRMGMALAANNDVDAAVEALTTAAAKGQEENANKQLSNIFLKKAVACQRAKDSKGALEAAQKSVEYVDNANGQKIIGLSAIALKQNKVAVEALQAYLAMQPQAKDKVQIIYQLGTALIGAGQNGEACGYFKQILNDPKWGEAAKYQITTLKCN